MFMVIRKNDHMTDIKFQKARSTVSLYSISSCNIVISEKFAYFTQRVMGSIVFRRSGDRNITLFLNSTVRSKRTNPVCRQKPKHINVETKFEEGLT